MDVSKSLKETHPQKYYLKLICRALYWLGIGDCWYEEMPRSKTHKFLYRIWAVIFNAFIILMTLNEVLANLRCNLSVKEKNDLLQFSFAHPSLCAKYIILIFQKDRVRVLFERLLEGTRPIFSSLEVDRESVKKAIIYVAVLALPTYGAVAFASLDAMMVYIKEGVPMRTEVVLYPTPTSSGFFVNILRFFSQVHWWSIVTNMCFVDSISVFSLIFVSYKFRIVKMYFESLRGKVEKNLKTKPKEVAYEEFKKDFIIGIRLHEDVLWCSRNVQYALGNIYSVQVFESMSLLVMCLIKLVAEERNILFLAANLTYIFCMTTITGAYFSAAGDIIHEASELSTSIFHCGWDLVSARKDLRYLAVVTIQRSQMPITMTAFGIITLSYENFISVLRSSYSFFAVMY